MDEISLMCITDDVAAGKPNFLIESNQGFKNVHEYRIFLSMLYKAYDGYDITKPLEIDISFINSDRGGSQYKRTKIACENIMKRVVNLLPDEKKKFKLRHLVRMADYTELSGTGKLKVEFDKDVVPYILSIFKTGNYTKIFLKHALPIRSVYSVRIYELLLQYKKLNDRNISIEKLRFFLNIPDGKHTKWQHLKQNILVPAQRHLEEYTDIKFEFEPIKKGKKKVTGIHFIIIENIPTNNTLQTDLFEGKENLFNEKILKIVKENLFLESQKEALEKFSPERIEYYYNYAKNAEREGRCKNFKGFFYTTLFEDSDDFENKQKSKIQQETIEKYEESKKLKKEKEEEELFNIAEEKFNLITKEEQQYYLDKVTFHPYKTPDMCRLMAIGIFLNEHKSQFELEKNRT